MKVKGCDLKRGDIARERGLILDVKLEDDPDGFWGGKPNYRFLDFHDSYYGCLTGELKVDEEFDILEDRKELVSVFNRIECDINKYITDMMELRREVKELKSNTLRRLNKK